jgi:hypothetical protein
MTPVLRKHMHALMDAIDRTERTRNPIARLVLVSNCESIGRMVREQARREGLLEGPPPGSLADADMRDHLGGGR